MHKEKPLKQFHLQVKTKLEAWKDVLQWFEEAIGHLLPKLTCEQCQLALVEGFTNVVRHAHQGLPEATTIDLEINLFSNCLEMRIWDWGKPFDLKAKLKSILKEDYDLLNQEGGRGLYLIDQVTDKLNYIRISNKRNCLIMQKKLSQKVEE